MYWWIKDVFVEREAYPEQQQQYTRQQVRFPALRKSWLNLKQHVRLNIEQRRIKYKIGHSHEVLSKLSDHYLADIGLRRIDLNVVANGSYPGHYQQSATTMATHRKLKIISGKNRKFLPKQDTQRNAGDYQKAA